MKLACAIVTVALGLAVAAPQGASARSNTLCVWDSADMHLSRPIYAIAPTLSDVTGSPSSNIGTTCSVDFMLSDARCESSSGSGTVNDGTHLHNVIWQHSGDRVVFTGDVVGSSSIHPNLLTGDNCLTGADNFLMTGSAVTL